ncbi:membrane protein [Luteipulveratus mongoliensis]|uniref:Membrane protein n=1 Tax=Luteipulveratus mongoliensis TaxID=571913 RepID=A0A0K1JQZ5_9MICO|nr:membrane protein [Luteipulveratus mongoliensis]
MRSGGRREVSRLDQPRELRRQFLPNVPISNERFGILSEKFARFMGTATFLIWMTIFVAAWLIWNTFAPQSAQFDPRSLNYTLLTLILSLQASYAAPLILLAQNRQDDRDKVGLEQDRARDERNLADTEFLTREVASLRLAMRDTATRDFVRSELRSLLEEMEERGYLRTEPEASEEPDRPTA